MKSSETESPRNQVRVFVGRKIEAIQNAYLSPTGKSKGARELAFLRHAVTRKPGDTPAIWGLEFEGMPDALVGRCDDPSPGEWAVHAALTLYAVHQQSQSIPMHRQGREYGLGQAMHQLVLCAADRYESLEPGELPRRFAALVTAESFSETMHYARQLVGQLRRETIPLDYALLAQQFYDLQFSEKANGVRRAWGRGFASCCLGEMCGQEQASLPEND